MHQRRDILKLAMAFGLGGATGTARSEAFNQVLIYYGFPAGSSGDIVARRVAEKLAGTPYARNPGVVENRPGAGGRIAMNTLKAAPKDGSTLALSPYSCTAVYPHVYSKLTYDPNKDFVPVSIGAVMHQGFAVGPLVPSYVKNLKDFIQWAKEHPKAASYGSPGAGTVPHFVGALFAMNAGLDMQHVPFRGSVPGVTDLTGGQIAAMSTPHGDFIPYHRAGRIRILATSGAQRSPFVPDVPTFAEQGFKEVTAEEWFGFFAPAGTPPSVVSNASLAIRNALKERTVIDSLASVGLIARGSTPEEMRRSQQIEFDRWKILVKKVGFTAES